MKLYLLRHGKADWPEWNRPDDERPLTEAGKKAMRRMAKLLSRLKVKPGSILTSPLPRARETAQIVAEQLKLELVEDGALSPGFDLKKLREILRRYRKQDLMIVGHESDFSLVVEALTGGRVKLAKGGIARVDLDRPDGAGRLIWLIPPSAAKR